VLISTKKFSLYQIRMYIHIYTIVALWLISHLIDDKMPTVDDTNNFMKQLINMELFEGSYLDVVVD
jgi:hypothetical protein